jgi:S-adenosylmethionine:tRNA ribosyltransferase-isomerase
MKVQELDFDLPDDLEAKAPPEARGLRRDETRLLVIHRATGQVEHRRFYNLIDYLRPGDVLVLNVSRTVPAALPGVTADGQEIELRLSANYSASGPANGRTWQAVFKPDSAVIRPGLGLSFASGALTARVQRKREHIPKLWEIEFAPNGKPLAAWLAEFGRPIKYDYADKPYNLDFYQTTYAAVPGSAEMPSAGRSFTPELLAQARAKGVALAQVVLHTGVSNIEIETEQVEAHRMYEEWYCVPPEAAQIINAARSKGPLPGQGGGRVFAVGTTVVRTLETASDAAGVVRPSAGWTNLYITPGYRFKAVDALITGLHEAKTTRLVLAAAFAHNPALVKRAYAEAVAQKYLWHEFGDVSLIL